MMPASVWMRSSSRPGMRSSGITVSRAVILMPELFGTGLGAGEMVAAMGRDLAGFFMSVANSLHSKAAAQMKSPADGAEKPLVRRRPAATVRPA